MKDKYICGDCNRVFVLQPSTLVIIIWVVETIRTAQQKTGPWQKEAKIQLRQVVCNNDQKMVVNWLLLQPT